MKPAKPLPRRELEKKLLISRLVTLSSYFGLLAVLLLGLVVNPPPEGARMAVILAVVWLPLLVFLPSILLKQPRPHAWLCFISLLYFMQGVTSAFLPEKAGLGFAQALLSLLLFTAAMLYGRWRSMQLRGAVLD
ncbi:DUF2069 domain-containing protein [Marinospirillum perlucidum]|uniref:DUF2069 domain-containing protein n=1 Tax=Marinospirillum perlucidum TaxID=1982602 RepID=UPI001FECA4AB|nr:DUF2069 domain-containing protein [Marinospirillum perlucidum]